ncbi:MAG: cation:proton antiporter [Solirubrobacterales bacterium]
MTLAAGTLPDSFVHALVALGLLLAAGALIAGLARRTFVSLTALFVVAGVVLGDVGLGFLEFDPESTFVEELAILALVLILFADGLKVDEEMLRGAWRLPARKLLIAMPITGGLAAVAAHLVTDLSWTESALIGALLAPTDPVLSSSVVGDKRVPREIRHSLNLESGLNDGLALPAVITLLAALGFGIEDDFVWWEFVLQDVMLGLATGLVVAWAASHVDRLVKPLLSGHDEMPDHEKSLYALGAAFTAYGVASLPPEGNGLIAVFVCAIALGILRPDLRDSFVLISGDDLTQIVKLGVFVVFGATLTTSGFDEAGLAGLVVAAVTFFVARPIGVMLGTIGSRQNMATRLFLSWFGPKGVATMSFALLVLASGVQNSEKIFHIAALAVFASILLHGLTDTPGARWIAERTPDAPGDEDDDEPIDAELRLRQRQQGASARVPVPERHMG